MKSVDKDILFLILFTIYMFLGTSLGELLGITRMITFKLVAFSLVIFVSYPFWNRYLNRFKTIYYYFLFILLYYIIAREYGIKSESIIPLTMLPFSLLIFMPREKNYKNIRNILLIFYILECVIAIVEKNMKMWILPHDLESDLYLQIAQVTEYSSWQFRASSLLGHPLYNANFVTLALCIILLSNFTIKTKTICYCLGMFALLAFNARFAIIVGSVVSTFLLYKQLQMEEHDNKYNRWFKLLIIFIGIICLAIYISTSEWGGRLLNEEELMDGSAQTRLILNDYISKIPLFPDTNIGLDKSENSFIFLLMTHGLVLGLPLLYFYLRFMMIAIKDFSWEIKLYLLLSFFVVGMSNNNLHNYELYMYFFIYVTAFNSSIREQSLIHKKHTNTISHKLLWERRFIQT